MNYTFGSYPGGVYGVREGTGDIGSLQISGVNLCLHVTHKQRNPVLFFEKAVCRFQTRCKHVSTLPQRENVKRQLLAGNERNRPFGAEI